MFMLVCSCKFNMSYLLCLFQQSTLYVNIRRTRNCRLKRSISCLLQSQQRQSSIILKNSIFQERRFQSRDSRVLKLFKEIQYVRRMVGPYSDRFPSNDLDDPSFSDPASGFLFMNYDSSCENRQLRGQRSDLALNRFLYEELDYEVCSKLKTVTMSHRRRDRAFEALRQRLFSKAYQ